MEIEILPGIARKEIPGYRGAGAHLVRRTLDQEVEFITLLWFDSLDSVPSFMGEDYEVARVPDAARAVLARFRFRCRSSRATKRVGAPWDQGLGAV